MNDYEDLTKILKQKFYCDENDSIKIKTPGRVNLIGEHTDYNEGFVLPCSIDLTTNFLGIPNKIESKMLRFFSLRLQNTINFSLDHILKDNNWGDYPKGVCLYLKEEKYNLNGIIGIIGGNLPIRCGLASSAALEIGILYLLKKIFNLKMEFINLAKIAFKAERQFVGVECGIMDQFVCTFGKKGYSIFLDCKSLTHEYIKLPEEDVKILIVLTNIQRDASTVLNKRKSECLEAVEILKKYDSSINSLRDLKIECYNKMKSKLPEILQRRCKHVIFENYRVLEAKDALKQQNLELFGKLMCKSHESLSEMYNVGCNESDIVFNSLNKISGVIGCRMTGAGLGGAIIALVETNKIANIIPVVSSEFHTLTNSYPICIIANSSDGVRETNQQC